MTTFQRIPLDKLEINPANDRHGDVGSESAAIEWLLVNKTDKMRDLLDDIHQRQGIVDEPLVMKKDGEDKYVVYDGNRRVTCLKLLHGLTLSNIQNPLAKKLETLRTKTFAANQIPQPTALPYRSRNGLFLECDNHVWHRYISAGLCPHGRSL